MFCKKCGAELSDDANFCRVCGSRVQDEVVASIPDTSKNLPIRKCPLYLISIGVVAIVAVIAVVGVILLKIYAPKQNTVVGHWIVVSVINSESGQKTSIDSRFASTYYMDIDKEGSCVIAADNAISSFSLKEYDAEIDDNTIVYTLILQGDITRYPFGMLSYDREEDTILLLVDDYAMIYERA